MQFVKVAQLGKTVKEVSLDTDATVATALEAAELRSAGFEVRLNGAPCAGTEKTRSGDIITLVPQIKGGH